MCSAGGEILADHADQADLARTGLAASAKWVVEFRRARCRRAPVRRLEGVERHAAHDEDVAHSLLQHRINPGHDALLKPTMESVPWIGASLASLPVTATPRTVWATLPSLSPRFSAADFSSCSMGSFSNLSIAASLGLEALEDRHAAVDLEPLGHGLLIDLDVRLEHELGQSHDFVEPLEPLLLLADGFLHPLGGHGGEVVLRREVRPAELDEPVERSTCGCTARSSTGACPTRNRAGVVPMRSTVNSFTISVERHQLDVLPGRPAEEREEVDDRLGQIAQARRHSRPSPAGRCSR